MTSTNSDDCSNKLEIDWTGKIMNNRYVLVKLLGKGSYASVWLSYDADDKNYKAIKINNRIDYNVGLKESANYNFIKQFNNKYLMNIIDNFDYRDEDEDKDKYEDEDEKEEKYDPYHCIVMNLMACSIYDIVRTKKFKDGIEFKYVLKIIHQVLQGLAELHKNNIIHGDIKPENILVSGISIQHNKIIEKLNFNKFNITNKNKNNKNKKLNNKNNLLKNISEEICKYFENNKTDTDDLSNYSSESSHESDISYFSDDYDKIEISDDITISTNISDIKYVLPHINLDNILDIQIKITDFGESLLPIHRKKREIQTCYYKSPEILLRLGYDISSDMWALGCTMYELLMGKILFDADDYDGNNERHHLYLIIKKLGILPITNIIDSPKKDIFFSKSNYMLKGYENIDFSSTIINDINEIEKKYDLTEKQKNDLCDFFIHIFTYNKEKRLTVEQSLLHELFL
jgi:serine/threonine protein kinase